ncbi:MAG TPA: hypothetical protein VD884_18440 [Ohtaekwangia sp.]|nr:hypothetical protein [Ohtaekwangia sp.]
MRFTDGALSFRQNILLTVILEFAVAIFAVGQFGFTLEGLQATTRYSGRLSLFIFSFIFLCQDKPDLLKKWLSDRYFLVFAIAHGIHLTQLITFNLKAGNDLIGYRILGGMLAYSFIFIMPMIQQRYNRGNITPRFFNTASFVYAYYIWFIFFMTYLPRVLGKMPQAGGSYTEYVMLLGWVSLIFGYRLSRLLQLKAK